MKSLFQQIHVRLAFIIASVSIFITCIVTVVNFQLEVEKQQTQSRDLLHKLAESSAKTAAVSIYASDKELATEIIRSLLIHDTLLAASIYGGDTLHASSRASANNIEPIVYTLTHPFNDRQITGSLKVYPNVDRIFEIARSEAQYQAIEMFIFAMLITVTLYIALYRYFTRPMSQLVKAFKEVKAGDPEGLRRINIGYTRKDELGRLIVGINILIRAVRSNFMAERKLRRKTEKLEQQFRLVFDKASVGIGMISTKKGVIIENPVFNNMVGMVSSIQDIVDMFDDSKRVEEIIHQLKSKTVVRPITVDLSYHVDGERRWLNCLFAAIVDQRKLPRDSDEVLIEVILNDVTERIEKESEARYRAQHDTLTNLYNRFGGQKRLSEMVENLSEQTVTYIMMLDLDRFKPINDTYGHDSGDIVIQVIAQRIKLLFNEPNDVCCRWGGDEFVVGFERELLSNSAMDTLCNTLLHSLELPIAVDNTINVAISASIGVVKVSNEDKDTNFWLSQADDAMYKVKRRGRANYNII